MLIAGTMLQSRYRIVRQIGGGGQALIYLADDTNLGGLRAVKELTPDANASPQEQQAAYDQFEREARILTELNHPHLVYVWEHFRVGGNAYLVMDYIDGQTLQEIMEQSLRFLPEAAVLRWAGQLCDVLDYLHRQQPPVIFRDLKPSNVMLDRSDTVKLIDFGIVRHFKAGQPTDTVSMGTPGYAPLEQHGRGQTDARSDLYALGATLYYLLTRHEPEPAPARVLPGQPDPLQLARTYNPGIMPSTDAALIKALAVDPNQRFQSAQEMKRALMGAVSAPTPTVTIPRPAPRRRIELRWPLLALAAFFVILVWFLMGRGEPGPRPILTVAPGERVWEKDGSIIVHVPAGEFLMGSPPGEGYDNEHPQHTVYVSEFWIDKTEVTNAKYRKCVEAGTCRAPTTCDWGEPTYSDSSKTDHPVVCVSWHDAKTYCEWTGKRLPTEAEWAKAARGTDGRKYPWGNSFDGSKVNFCDVNCESDLKDRSADDGYQRTAPVGSYPEGASPYGALDMAGNVEEWCQDWYDEDYYASSPQRDPQGPSSGLHRVVRGGSWVHNSGGYVRAAWRLRAGVRISFIGFRCVSQSPVGYDTPTPVPPSPTAVPTATAIPTVTPTAPMPGMTIMPRQERVWEKDDSIIVRVPAGEFLMGSPPGEGFDDQHPQHTVYVSEFWIDKTEVTNAQYRKCVEAGTCRAPTTCDAGEPTYSDSSKADHPVVCVSWQDAKTYCEWAGKRLPTEAEWEKAARGTDGRKYPWGKGWDASKVNSWEAGPSDTTAVGSYPAGASPYGALDMTGNVCERCQDWYGKNYYASSPLRDPQGSTSGEYRVVRGGSWIDTVGDMPAAERVRLSPGLRGEFIGFRCVSQSP